MKLYCFEFDYINGGGGQLYVAASSLEIATKIACANPGKIVRVQLISDKCEIEK